MGKSLYSDLNQYSPTRKPQLEDMEAINQSLNNIIGTRRYERLFNNTFGLDFEDELFELIDDDTSLEILRIIAERVSLYEPRVEIDFSNSVVSPDPDNNKYSVLIVYNLVNQPDLGAQEFRGVVSKS